MAGETAEVAKYTEAQLAALVTDGVTRETAAITAANEELQSQVDTLTGEKAELETKVTGLEAEVAAERTAKETAEQDLADYKAEQEEAAERQKLRQERVDAIKAAAKGLHPDDYYTEERAASWASMNEESFANIVEAVTAAAESAGKTDADVADKGKETARETAAFAAGGKPTATDAETNVSTTRAFFAAGGRLPVGA